jgi:hypothetical protein
MKGNFDFPRIDSLDEFLRQDTNTTQFAGVKYALGLKRARLLTAAKYLELAIQANLKEDPCRVLVADLDESDIRHSRPDDATCLSDKTVLFPSFDMIEEFCAGVKAAVAHLGYEVTIERRSDKEGEYGVYIVRDRPVRQGPCLVGSRARPIA